MEKGLLIILSGPSGVGKGTVRKKLMEMYPEFDIQYSISMTTRKPRNQEVNGVDYFFVTNEEFDNNLARDNFLEHASFVGNRYGTPKDYVENLLNKNKIVLLEIEINGAKQVLEKVKDTDNHVSIFLTTDLETLRERITNRKTESEAIINERLEKAKKEFGESSIYDYVVKNVLVEQAAEDIANIIKSKIKLV